MTKLIFLGCLSRTRYQKTCKNATKIIKQLDSEYEVLEDVPCCGALAYHIGSDSELKNHVIKFGGSKELEFKVLCVEVLEKITDISE